MCIWILRLFTLAYVGALILYIVATFGLFGSPEGPLAGIFLFPLGLPWNLLLDAAPEAAKPWLGAASPILNILILRWLCSRFAAG